MVLCLLLLAHCSPQQNSKKRNGKKGRTSYSPAEYKISGFYRTVLLEFTLFFCFGNFYSESAINSTIENLQRQIDDITRDLTVLKEQQALQTGVDFFTNTMQLDFL